MGLTAENTLIDKSSWPLSQCAYDPMMQNPVTTSLIKRSQPLQWSLEPIAHGVTEEGYSLRIGATYLQRESTETEPNKHTATFTLECVLLYQQQ